MTDPTGGPGSLREPVDAWVGLGGNLGDPLASVDAALARMGHLSGTECIARSSLYRSAPVDADGPDYVNAVARLRTRLSAPALLAVLQDMEREALRERPYPNAPRTLDLDLLFYGDAHIDSPTLTVPHPRWRERAFVLLPLAELSPGRVMPADLAAVQGQRIARI